MALYVPQAAKRDVALAEAYFSRDPQARAVLSSVERSQRHFRITINARGDDHFDADSDTIAWDPHSALRTTQGGRQSPALGLAHELAHAAEDPRREAALDSAPLTRYDNREEQRVIDGCERHAARTLGEAVRCDHRGSLYRVATPVSR